MGERRAFRGAIGVAIALALGGGFGCGADSPAPEAAAAPEASGAAAPESAAAPEATEELAGDGEVVIPDDLSVGLVIDGKDREPLTKAVLSVRPADSVRGEGKAWRLAQFFPEDSWNRNRAVLQAEDSNGDAVRYKRPGRRADGRELFLVVNQKGTPIVTTMAREGSDEGVGGFHGRGGQRGRRADGALRVHGVTRLELSRADRGPKRSKAQAVGVRGARTADEERRLERRRERARGAKGRDGSQRGRMGGAKRQAQERQRGEKGQGGAKPKIEEPKSELVLVLDDGKRVALTTADLEAAGTSPVAGQGGQGVVRLAASLRRLVTKRVGPGAALTKVVPAKGDPRMVSAEEWADPKKTPSLRVNRRGEWRFHWLDEANQPIQGGGTHRVTELHVVRGG